MRNKINLTKSCSVFGHSKIDITDRLTQKLKQIFENLITVEKVRHFYFGGLGDFDNLCWQIVTELKEKHQDITRTFCLYDPRHKRLVKRPKWLKNEDFEEIIYLDLDYDYWYTRIYYRNCEIINRSDFVVFYVEHSEQSGSCKALQYAKKQHKQIINVSEII